MFLAVKEVQTLRREVAYKALKESTYAFLEANARGDAPIVISGPLDFTELTYAAPPQVAERLTYLADPGLALRYTGSDDAEQGLVEMKSLAGLRVEAFSRFLSSGKMCYVYAVDFPDKYAWVVRGLVAAHLKVALVRWEDGMMLFSATPDVAVNRPAGSGR